jgi:hypothetical protein
MSQRKGLADVFAAMKLLDRTDVELVVLGTPIARWSSIEPNMPTLPTKADSPPCRSIEANVDL